MKTRQGTQNDQHELLMETIRNAATIEQFELSAAYKLIIEPLKKQRETLKAAYECKTLIEMHRIRGWYEALSSVLNHLEDIKKKGEIARIQKQKMDALASQEAKEYSSIEL